jgi:murein tripeptide amidase MpaA
MPVAIQFDRFYKYSELTQLLQAYVDAYPQLLRLESIGKSHEGRDIWAVTATLHSRGPAEDKPAFWFDGNIHAGELAASTACLYYLNELVTGYGQDRDITHLLDTRTIYLVPRLNPDGAELAMADRPKYIRSSTRPYPHDEDAVEGLNVEDIDGDGRILSMRIPDPNGGYKKHPHEPRLMVARDPDEFGGEYYRLMPEGTLVNYDGVNIAVNRDKEGLDLNRNFPAYWRQEFEQFGAGPYPTSEPEVRAMVDFIIRHPNICGGISYHTHSGVILRPMGTEPDKEMIPEDLWLFKKFGEKGAALTGYPCISIYEDFRYHPKEVITGCQDWMYEHLGMFFYTIEIWAPNREAGIEKYDWIHWYREHPVEDDLKLLKWSDDQLNGEGYFDWRPFQHPQLGPVEIGGWNKLGVWRNPPKHLLEKEVKRFPKWMTWHALATPRLELFRTDVTPLGGGTFHIRLAVQNTGYLPTYVTKRALARKTVRGVVYEISLPPGATLLSGKLRVEGGQLEGRANRMSQQAFLPNRDITGDRGQCEWVVQLQGTTTEAEVEVTARHERAGKLGVRLPLAWLPG